MVGKYATSNTAFFDYKKYSNMNRALGIDPLALNKQVQRKNLK
jgi:hypothetical protein